MTDLLAATRASGSAAASRPAMQLRVIGAVYLIDVCLTPVGLAIAMACTGRPYAFLLVLPLPRAAVGAGRRPRAPHP